MNYLKAYNNIVEKASSRGLRKNKNKFGYTEIHHIKPRCMGGTDDKENLVQVTAREHYILHLLLTKIYPDEHGLITAVFLMGSLKIYRVKTNSRIFETVKIKNLEVNKTKSIRMWKNPVIREKIIERMKEYWSNPMARKKASINTRGLWKNPEYKSMMSNMIRETWQRPEFKENMFESRSKMWEKEGYREKREASIQKALKETNYREKLSKASKEMWETRPEVREKVSKSSKEMWKNPEYKSMMSNMIRERWQREDFKENMFKSRSAMWKKNGYRERRTYSMRVTRLKKHFEHPLWDDYFILYEIHHQFKTFGQLYRFVKKEYPEYSEVDFRRLWKDFKKDGLDIPNEVFN